MAKITNYARGPRGISLKDGSTIWLDPGQSEDIKKDDIAGPLPDLGAAPAAASSDDSDDRVAALSAEIDSLKADHEKALAAEKQRADDAEKLLSEASAEIDSLKAQIAKFDADGDGKPGGSKAADKK
jgi:uncharacterized small protein (DUF1192 family)